MTHSELIIATRNAGKAREFREMLAPKDHHQDVS